VQAQSSPHINLTQEFARLGYTFDPKIISMIFTTSISKYKIFIFDTRKRFSKFCFENY